MNNSGMLPRASNQLIISWLLALGNIPGKMRGAQKLKFMKSSWNNYILLAKMKIFLLLKAKSHCKQARSHCSLSRDLVHLFCQKELCTTSSLPVKTWFLPCSCQFPKEIHVLPELMPYFYEQYRNPALTLLKSYTVSPFIFCKIEINLIEITACK